MSCVPLVGQAETTARPGERCASADLWVLPGRAAPEKRPEMLADAVERRGVNVAAGRPV